MVIPSPDPEPAAEAMRQALNDAAVEPSEVDYINAHATSTPVGDIAETHVIEAVLGDAVRRVPVSSTKSMTGHCLTAAAAALLSTTLIGSVSARPPSTPGYSVANVGAYGGEPSIVSDTSGHLYDAFR